MSLTPNASPLFRTTRESYNDGCPAVAQDVSVKGVSNTISGCPNCLSIQEAMSIRTKFDQQQITMYNNLRQTYNTNLLSLKMPH